MTNTILIIDDEADIRDLLADIFEDEGYHILRAAHSEQALSLLDDHQIDLVVLDIWLDNSDMDGVQILKHLKKSDRHKSLPILMISGHGNVEMAVNAMKMGAFDFIEKPFKIDHILLTVQRALEQKSLREENSRLKKVEVTGGNGIGAHYKSPAMAALVKHIDDYSESDTRMFIVGEFGTGKTRLARAIHENSKRALYSMSSVHMRDTTIEMLSDILFENPKGSVILKAAHLLSQSNQNALLNLLSKDDVQSRLIVTSDVVIDDMVSDGRFSSALYDRLAVTRFDVPALKNRMDDFSVLVNECYEALRVELDFMDIDVSFSQNTMSDMKSQTWPGNIRQLRSVVELMMYDSVSYSGQNNAKKDHFDVNGVGDVNAGDMNIVPYSAAANDQINSSCFAEGYENLSLKQARDKFECEYLSHMLGLCDGNIAQMAGVVEMDRAALHRKLKSMNIGLDNRQTVKVEN